MRVVSHFALWSVGVAAAETQTTDAERGSLAAHARGRSQLVEIGVWHGVTTRRLRAVMAPGGLLWAVDPYPVGRLGFSVQRVIAHREVEREQNGSVRWIRETGVNAAAKRREEGGEPPDFIFIDGDHSVDGLRGDWEAWSPLVRPNGLVALHDSRSTPDRNIDDAGSVRFTREIIMRDPGFGVIDTVDSLTILRRGQGR